MRIASERRLQWAKSNMNMSPSSSMGLSCEGHCRSVHYYSSSRCCWMWRARACLPAKNAERMYCSSSGAFSRYALVAISIATSSCVITLWWNKQACVIARSELTQRTCEKEGGSRDIPCDHAVQHLQSSLGIPVYHGSRLQKVSGSTPLVSSSITPAAGDL